MSLSTLPFSIEPMILADIPAVMAVEQVSYAMTRPARAYEHELQQNKFAHYFVLRTSLIHPPIHLSPAEAAPEDFGDPPSVVSGLIGLAGFWLMADEVHISTIAVQPHWRGLGLGEWLLLTLLEAGQPLDATVATLEVRPSNHNALALYHKYQFEQVGRRSHYYSDNDEDALILTTPRLTLPDYQAMLSQRKVALFQRLAKIERYSG